MYTHSISHLVGLAILLFSLGACSRSSTEASSHDAHGSHASHDVEAAPTLEVTQPIVEEPPTPSEVADAPAQDPSSVVVEEGDGTPKQKKAREKQSRRVDQLKEAEPPKEVEPPNDVEPPKEAAPEVEHVEHVESPKPAPHAGHHHGH